MSLASSSESDIELHRQYIIGNSVSNGDQYTVINGELLIIPAGHYIGLATINNINHIKWQSISQHLQDSPISPPPHPQFLTSSPCGNWLTIAYAHRILLFRVARVTNQTHQNHNMEQSLIMQSSSVPITIQELKRNDINNKPTDKSPAHNQASNTYQLEYVTTLSFSKNVYIRLLACSSHCIAAEGQKQLYLWKLPSLYSHSNASTNSQINKLNNSPLSKNSLKEPINNLHFDREGRLIIYGPNCYIRAYHWNYEDKSPELHQKSLSAGTRNNGLTTNNSSSTSCPYLVSTKIQVPPQLSQKNITYATNTQQSIVFCTQDGYLLMMKFKDNRLEGDCIRVPVSQVQGILLLQRNPVTQSNSIIVYDNTNKVIEVSLNYRTSKLIKYANQHSQEPLRVISHIKPIGPRKYACLIQYNSNRYGLQIMSQSINPASSHSLNRSLKNSHKSQSQQYQLDTIHKVTKSPKLLLLPCYTPTGVYYIEYLTESSAKEANSDHDQPSRTTILLNWWWQQKEILPITIYEIDCGWSNIDDIDHYVNSLITANNDGNISSQEDTEPATYILIGTLNSIIVLKQSHPCKNWRRYFLANQVEYQSNLIQVIQVISISSIIPHTYNSSPLNILKLSQVLYENCHNSNQSFQIQDLHIAVLFDDNSIRLLKLLKNNQKQILPTKVIKQSSKIRVKEFNVIVNCQTNNKSILESITLITYTQKYVFSIRNVSLRQENSQLMGSCELRANIDRNSVNKQQIYSMSNVRQYRVGVNCQQAHKHRSFRILVWGMDHLVLVHLKQSTLKSVQKSNNSNNIIIFGVSSDMRRQGSESGNTMEKQGYSIIDTNNYWVLSNQREGTIMFMPYDSLRLIYSEKDNSCHYSYNYISNELIGVSEGYYIVYKIVEQSIRTQINKEKAKIEQQLGHSLGGTVLMQSFNEKNLYNSLLKSKHHQEEGLAHIITSSIHQGNTYNSKIIPESPLLKKVASSSKKGIMPMATMIDSQQLIVQTQQQTQGLSLVNDYLQPKYQDEGGAVTHSSSEDMEAELTLSLSLHNGEALSLGSNNKTTDSKTQIIKVSNLIDQLHQQLFVASKQGLIHLLQEKLRKHQHLISQIVEQQLNQSDQNVSNVLQNMAQKLIRISQNIKNKSDF